MVTHQTNSTRLTTLRARTTALDADIKSKIRQLAETRKGLQNIPAYDTTSDGLGAAGKEIDVQELLRYAKFISKTSVPPTVPKMRAEPVKVVEAGGEGGSVKKEKGKDEEGKPQAQLVNGTSSPAAAPTATALDQPGTGEAGAAAGEDEKETATIHALTKGHRAFINQTLRFEPWPEHLTIQRGALGAIQRMVEAGQDPASVLSAEEKEARRREEEERGEREREERERRGREGGRRGSVLQGQRQGHRGRVEEEKVFNPDDM